MIRTVRLVGVIGVLLLSLLLAAVQAEAAVMVTISPKAKLVEQGGVLVRVEITCDAPGDVVEAFVTLSQDNQAIFGQGGIGGVRCDGKRHHHRAVVRSQQDSFHKGTGYASAFLLICPAEGQCQSGGDVEENLVIR
jgi:hypothetical protein